MSTWTPKHSVALFLILVFVAGLQWQTALAGCAYSGWLLSLGLMTIAITVAGHGVVGVWRGALIDSDNCISLSRFQMTLWTVLVLSAFATATVWNVVHNQAEPLKIVLPNTLWLLMGISTTSLVGSPLVMSNKRNLDPSRQEAAEFAFELKKQGDSPSAITTKGLIVANNDPSLARWSDLFTGDEVANATRMDLTRLQMLFFTLVTAFAYAVALGHKFAGLGAGARFDAFPAFDESALALIGISHAGYLVAKGVTHTDHVAKTGDSPSVAGAIAGGAEDEEAHVDGCEVQPTELTSDDQLPRATGGVA